MAFRFKQFSVEDQQSSMRVGSDAVLLGAWADTDNDLLILDVGTGCGIISLMTAQRSQGRIDALDIHLPSLLQARENFSKSPWHERLHTVHRPLREFASGTHEKYNHIITNPPFFRKSLKSPDPSRNNARHEDSLTFEELLSCSVHLLETEGKISLILPPAESRIFTDLASQLNIFLTRKMDVKPKVNKPVNRVLMEFSIQPNSSLHSSELSIREEDGSYTTGYRKFTDPFYFSLK